MEVEVRTSCGAGVVDEPFDDLPECGQLQEEDLDYVQTRALGGKEQPSRRRRGADEPRPARGKGGACSRARNRELVPGPAAEGVGERFEVERRRHGQEERRAVERQRREEIADGGAAAHGRGERAHRVRGLRADQSGGFLRRPDLAQRVAQIVEEVGCRTDGGARRADSRGRVDRGRLGSRGAAFAPHEAVQRRREGRESRAGEPRLVAAERERIPAARARRNEERARGVRIEKRGEAAGDFTVFGIDTDESREVGRERAQLDESRVLPLPPLLEVAVRHAEGRRRRAVRPGVRHQLQRAELEKGAVVPLHRGQVDTREIVRPRESHPGAVRTAGVRDVEDDMQAERRVRPGRRQKSRGLDPSRLLHCW